MTRAMRWGCVVLAVGLAAGPRLRGADPKLELVVQTGHTSGVTAVAFSADGQRVLSGSLDHTAILWEAASGKQLQTLQGHTDIVLAAALSSDGQRVLTGSWDKTAILWETVSGKKLLTFTGHTGLVNAVAFSGDGRRVLTGSDDKTAILWDAASGKKLLTFTEHTAEVNAAALSADGQEALTGSEDKTAILWEAASGKKLQTFAGHTGGVRSVAFSADGQRILTGSSDKTAILWDVASGKKLQTFTGHTNGVNSVALSGDGQRVLTGSWDNTAILWEAASGKKLQTFTGHTGVVKAVGISADGQRVLTGSGDKTAILWDAVSGKKLHTFTGHSAWVAAVALSADGQRALTGSADNTAMLWDAASGKKLQTFGGHTFIVTAVAFSGDGERALTGSWDKTAILWEAVSGKKLQTFTGHTSGVNAAALSGDGRRVLTGSDDETAILWEVASGKKLQTLTGHTSIVVAVAISGDGQRALTGSEDHTAILWEAAGGKMLQTFMGHTGRVQGVALSADGKRALTASWDGTTRIWDTATGEELCRLISIDGGQDWLALTPDGLFDGSVNAPRFISYRLAGTLEFVPLEKYRHFYYTPGLFAKIMRGERPRPKVDIAKALPPKVRIVSPTQAAEVKDGMVEVKAEAESRGDHPVVALHLLLDGRQYQGQKSRFRIEAPTLGRVEGRWLVEMGPGLHRLQVLADTRLVEGIASEEVEVRYVGGEARVELPVLYILAVGISNYGEDKLNLDYAADDARAVADAYATHSKALYRKVERRILIDKEATREAILEGLKWLRTEATQRDYVVFFFAGHGEKDSTGTLYFLPADADLKRLEVTGIHQDQMKGQLVNLPGKVTAILDACHAGRIAEGGKKRNAAGLTDDLLRELMAAENGLVVLCAATGNESALESRTHKHGIFAQTLLEGLAATEVTVGEGKATRKLRAQPDRDGAVFFHQLEGFLYDRVKGLSKGQQHPIVFKPDGMRSFPVSKPRSE